VVRLGIVWVRVRAAGGLLVGFLGLWCHDAAEVVEGMASVEYGYVVEVGCVELMMQLLEWRLLPLLLVKDLNGVLEHCEPRSLFVMCCL
jgi:hypothetical protein